MKIVLLLFIIAANSTTVTKIGEYDSKEECMKMAQKLEKQVASKVAEATVGASLESTRARPTGYTATVSTSCEIMVGKLPS